MDGDAKINYKEFEIGIKSNLTIFSSECQKKNRPKSGHMHHSPSHKQLKCQRSLERLVTPKNASKVRPDSCGRLANTRRRETELKNAKSLNLQGPNSNYFLQQENHQFDCKMMPNDVLSRKRS